MDMHGILEAAQNLQREIARVQEELAAKSVEAQAGGGMVTAVVSGRQELMSLRIEKAVIDPNDQGMLQDLIVAAVNLGLRKSQELAQQEIAKVTGGVPLPPGVL
jgi:DNA-binding YbaB/EbfC family protein